MKYGVAGSTEELEALKTAYVEFEGDMEEVINSVMCSTYEDEQRFSKIIKDWIKKKEVPDFPKFSKESKKSRENRKRKVSHLCMRSVHKSIRVELLKCISLLIFDIPC